MADTVEGAPVVAPEQESRSFELPTEEPPAAAAAEESPPAAAVEDGTPPPPAEDDAGSSSSSSDDEGEKKVDPVVPGASELPAKAGGKWNQLLNTVQPVVRKHADTIANHPYVTGTASTLRQRAGQAQERIQPIVNHPYVQKGTGAIKAGGAKTFLASTDKRVLGVVLVTVGLGLLIRVLLQKYPEFGGYLKMKI